MRKATMRDVSEATGFSMFTVSRALNGGDGVADDSRELILKVARELGYVPNRAAQALRRSSRDSVAVITAQQIEATGQLTADAAAFAVDRGAWRYCGQRHLRLRTGRSDD